MQPLNMTLVAGPSGAGKTTWIQQQVHTIAESAIYLSLGSGEPSVDATYLAAEVPGLIVLPVMQLTDFLELPPVGCAVYLELGFHIDLTSLILPDKMANCRRVVVLPPGTRHPEWHDRADLVVAGAETDITLQHPHIWRSALMGQVLDSASLNAFWYELTNGAYGNIQRAKGIFDLADGWAFYFDFTKGLSKGSYIELNLPRWLDGRPDRFSGIEVVGEALEQEMIAQTLKDCCLEEQAIAYYQQQIKDLIKQGEEVP
jgi:hypothetical protein